MANFKFSKYIIPDFKVYSRINQRGGEIFEKEMNIAKILKDIRHMKIILKNLLLSPELKFEVQNSYENVIDFDLSSDDYDTRDNSSKQLFN